MATKSRKSVLESHLAEQTLSGDLTMPVRTEKECSCAVCFKQGQRFK